MANIAKRSDGRWRARYRDQSGKEIARHFERKIDAQRWLDSVTTAVANGVYVDPARSRITVAEWSQKWLDTKTNLKATTRRDYESLLHAHIRPRWGELALAEVEREDVTTWLAELTAHGLSASRVRAAHVALSQMLKLAVALAEVAGRIVYSTPKTHQSRSVPIPRFLVDEIAELVVGKDRHEHVFTRPDGQPLRLSWFRRAVFMPAVAAAGLDGLTPHGLRHTAASLAIASGADVKVVQTMLGHASATMTLDLYGHLYADRLDEVADAMDAARRASRADSQRILADYLRTEPAVRPLRRA